MLRVKYIDTAPDAAGDAALFISDKKSYSNPADVLTDDEIRLGQTLELNRTVLDGTWPENPEEMSGHRWGIESLSLCGEDCRFAEPPTLEITLSNQHSSVGLTFDFGENWCQELEITWRRGGAVLKNQTYYPTSAVFFCEGRVELFSSVTIAFKEMSFPHSYLRVRQLIFGAVRIFERDEISRGDMYMASSLLSEEMQIDTFNLSIRSKTSIEFMFQRKQRLETERNGQLIAVHYITASRRDGANAWSIDAEGVLGLLDASRHAGGIFTGQTADSVISSVMGGYAYTLEPALQNIPLYGWLPEGSRRENLQRILFAIGGIEVAGSDGTLHIRPPATEISSVIPMNRAYLGGNVPTQDVVTAVEVTEYTYSPSDEIATLFEGASPGKVIFPEPHHSLSISGGTILESGANFAVISGSNVTLTGKRYNIFTRTIRADNPDVSATDLEKIVTADCTLVSPYNSQAVADRMMTYYRRRNRVRADIVWEDESPGDIIYLPTLFSGDKTGHIATMNLTLSGTIKAGVEVVEL